jgi:hypothetical protein
MAVGYYYHYLWRAMKMKAGLFSKIKLLFLPPDQTPKPDMNYKIRRGKKRNVPFKLEHYAYFQLACAVPGLIVMLVYKDFLPVWEIALYAVIGITSISGAAMILNRNIRNSFYLFELFRLGILFLCVLMLSALKMKFYLLPVAFFLLISLFISVTLQKRNATSSNLKLLNK